MEVVNLNVAQNEIGLRGECPHCQHPSYFRPVTTPHVRVLARNEAHICVATECQNCGGHVLAEAMHTAPALPYVYEAHYPLGKPNDAVDAAVPPDVGKDFAEALRCQWVKSFRATAVMCRRALQASCHALGAKDGRLIDEIDDLASQGKITTSLEEMAHEVRVVGNAGAHPDADGLEDVSERDAGDAVEFVREFFNHVFVMPGKLASIKARRTGGPTPTT